VDPQGLPVRKEGGVLLVQLDQLVNKDLLEVRVHLGLPDSLDLSDQQVDPVLVVQMVRKVVLVLQGLLGRLGHQAHLVELVTLVLEDHQGWMVDQVSWELLGQEVRMGSVGI